MKRFFLCSAIAAGVCLSASAQNDQDLLNLSLGARVDWQYDRIDGHTNDDYSGFTGKYIMLRADGQLFKGFTYSWRQRFNKSIAHGSFFDATDWLYVQYKPGRYGVSAGKEIVAIGGYEYDRYPLDVFASSVFWYNIPCYSLGVSGKFDLTPKDMVQLQIVQSPFHASPGNNNNTYGYSIFWSATHGIWKPLYSINLFEYHPGSYINYIALGNRFDYGQFSLEADFMNRAASGQTFLFKDCSVMADLGWNVSDSWKVHLKYTYDVNKSGTDKDFTVGNGTELNSISAGAEFWPLKKDRWSLRLHADCAWYWGRNTFSAAPMQDKTLFASVGVTWHMNFLKIKSKN